MSKNRSGIVLCYGRQDTIPDINQQQTKGGPSWLQQIAYQRPVSCFTLYGLGHHLQNIPYSIIQLKEVMPHGSIAILDRLCDLAAEVLYMAKNRLVDHTRRW